MMRSLWISKSGMEAQQTQLDHISQNLANSGTNGYKQSHAIFEDLMYQNLRQAGARLARASKEIENLQAFSQDIVDSLTSGLLTTDVTGRLRGDEITLTAGAMAGLVSGAVGATLYALTCPDDSTLFVATWYSIAIIAVTAASAYLGSRILDPPLDY